MSATRSWAQTHATVGTSTHHASHLLFWSLGHHSRRLELKTSVSHLLMVQVRRVAQLS
jgi:hypothetical protein